MKDTKFCNKHTWNIGGELINFSTPKIMGIVNCTPDSFYDASRAETMTDVVRRVSTMVQEGVDMVDVGGYSSRPGASDVDEKEELKRVIPVIMELKKQFPTLIISIDTFRSHVAEMAIGAGAQIINDISGGDLDGHMFAVVKETKAPYVIMHMRGNPSTAHKNTDYQQITMDVVKDLSEKLYQLRLLGVHDVAVDPGFGFSKTVAQNFELLHDLPLFQPLDCPVLVGLSRKSMLYKPLQISPNDALNATSVVNTIAMLNGAAIVRVHDVKEAVEARQLVTFTQNPSEIKV